MAFNTMHVSLYLAVFLSAAYGKPHSFPVVKPNNHPECNQPDSLMTCYAPVLAFIMSPEGQQLQQLGRPGVRISDVITESVFRHMCSLAQPLISCTDNWMIKCLEIPPELLASQQMMARANVKMLSVCNETDGYSKIKTLLQCGEKIQNQVSSCAQTIGPGIWESQRRSYSSVNVTSETAQFTQLLKAVNPQNMGCCFVKKFKECIAPSVQSTCTVDEKTVTKEVGDRITEAYECTDAIYQAC